MPQTTQAKKLASISTTSASVTEVIKKDDKQLECMPYIQYPVKFKKDCIEIQALLDSGSEVNTMTPAYAAKLGLRICLNDVGAKKIDGSTLSIYCMMLANF